MRDGLRPVQTRSDPDKSFMVLKDHLALVSFLSFQDLVMNKVWGLSQSLRKQGSTHKESYKYMLAEIHVLAGLFHLLHLELNADVDYFRNLLFDYTGYGDIMIFQGYDKI